MQGDMNTGKDNMRDDLDFFRKDDEMTRREG